jgi:hypothetical protein
MESGGKPPASGLLTVRLNGLRPVPKPETLAFPNAPDSARGECQPEP